MPATEGTAHAYHGHRPVAVVTGASRGLGFLLARELARHEHDLVVCARSADGIEQAAAALRTEDTKVSALAADVSVQAQAAAVIDRAVAEFGRLDVLVTNAGVIQVGPVSALETDDFADAMAVMYWGAVHPTLAALSVMRRAGRGRVINITSIGGKLPAPHLLPYTAAKHASVGFSEGLRVEMAKHGISVTTAVPGLMRTGSPDNALFAGKRTEEHAWFTIADSLPILSMDAERAACAIVRAGLRGEPEIVLTPAAKLAVRVHAMLPGLTLRALSVVDRMLPGDGGRAKLPGHRVSSDATWFHWLTSLTRAAAARWHERDDLTDVDGTPKDERHRVG
jgi:NAD(P)-dependent dehydrogenase (short-subunit alcohol dehydrogenase family)